MENTFFSSTGLTKNNIRLFDTITHCQTMTAEVLRFGLVIVIDLSFHAPFEVNELFTLVNERFTMRLMDLLASEISLFV